MAHITIYRAPSGEPQFATVELADEDEADSDVDLLHMVGQMIDGDKRVIGATAPHTIAVV